MKKILIMMISLTLSAGAFAQRKGVRSPHRSRVFTHVYVTPSFGYGFGYGYPYFGYGYPYFGYPYDYGFPPYGYRPRLTYKLNAQINAVKSEYTYKIKAVRKDKSISRDQRKQDIFKLKSERESAIADVEEGYTGRRMNMMNKQQGINNVPSPANGSNNPETNKNPGL